MPRNPKVGKFCKKETSQLIAFVAAENLALLNITVDGVKYVFMICAAFMWLVIMFLERNIAF